jgi:hypothetical protein
MGCKRSFASLLRPVTNHVVDLSQAHMRCGVGPDTSCTSKLVTNGSMHRNIMAVDAKFSIARERCLWWRVNTNIGEIGEPKFTTIPM